VIIERWEVIEYSFINVFILAFYLVGIIFYIFLYYKEKTLRKVLIHLIIGAIIVIAITSTIALISPKYVHMYYQYEDNADMIGIIQNGWDVLEHAEREQRIHIRRRKE